MFCRFCGKEISDDSTFCAFCGKRLGKSYPSRVSEHVNDDIEEKLRSQEDKRPSNSNSKTNAGFHDICFFLSLGLYVLFFVLYKEVDPYAWLGNYFCYVIVIIVGIALFLIIQLHADTNTKSILALLIPVLLVSSVLSLKHIYNSKLDSVLASPPQVGYSYVSVNIKDTYYNSTGEGHVKDPYIDLRFDGQPVRNGIVNVPLEKRIIVTADVSYIWVYNGNVKGTGNTNIILKKDDIMRGTVFKMEFPTQGDQSCVLVIKLSRKLGFWDVVLFKV